MAERCPGCACGGTVDVAACIENLAAALERQLRASQRRSAPQLGAMTAGQVAQVATGLAGFCRQHRLPVPAALPAVLALLAARQAPPTDDLPAVQLPKELAQLVQAEIDNAKSPDPLRPAPDYAALDGAVIRVAQAAGTSRPNVRRWRTAVEIRRAVHERLAGDRLVLLQLLEAASCALTADRRRLTYLAPACRLADLAGLGRAVVESHRSETKYVLAVLDSAAALQDQVGEMTPDQALASLARELAVTLPEAVDLAALQSGGQEMP